MRIVQVTDCFLPRMGGIETQVSRLADELVAQGHDVTVLTATADGSQKGLDKPWDGPTARKDWVERALANPGTEQSGEYRVVRSPWRNPLGLPVDPRGGRRFAKYIRRHQPDVVNFHMGELTPVVMATIAALRGARIPTVVTIHSVWSNGPTALGYGAAAKALGLDKEPILWVPVSELVAKNVRRVVGEANVRILGNGINQAQWRTEPVPHEGLRAVAATRFAPRKRVPQLLKTLKTAGEELGINGATPAVDPTGLIEVVLAGEGPGLRWARSYLRKHGMDSWVRTPGRLSQDGLRELYGSSDIFLAPGVKDSFSIAGREALIAGLAVLTRSQSGLGADLADGVEGRSVPADSQMAEVLVDWIRDPSRLQKIKQHNLRTNYRYAWEQVLPQTIQMYADAARLVEDAGR